MPPKKSRWTTEELDAYRESCLRIVPEAIQEDYIRLAADMGFWNEHYATAYSRWLELKMRRDTMYATRYAVVRAQLEANTEKKVPIADVEQAMSRDEGYLQASTALIGAEAEKVRLWGVLDALRCKRDMLVSLGAHMRAEMAAGLNEGD